MTSTLKGVGGKVGGGRQIEMLLDLEGWGISECSGRRTFIFFTKKIGFAP